MLDVMDIHIASCVDELKALTSGLGRLFARPEPREIFHDLVEGLLSDLGKKNGWVRHEAPCDRVGVRDLHRRAVAAVG